MVNKNDSSSVWDAYRERGISEEQIKILKERVKNTAGREVDTEYRTLNFQFTVPLDNFEYDNMAYILTLYSQWEKGNLPFSGSISEQPNKVVDIMNLLESLKFEQQEKAQKESQKKAEKVRR